jgi:Na+/proline symporter
MSTADSNLHALSAVFTRDVYDRYLRPRASSRERTNVGRAVILVATLLALLLVLGGHRDGGGALGRSMQMIVDVGVLAISFSAQLVPIAVDILWIRRGSAIGAAAGLAAGLATTCAVKVWGAPFAGAVIGEGARALEIRMMEGAWGILANVAVFAALSARARPPAKAAEFTRILAAASDAGSGRDHDSSGDSSSP